MGSSRKLVWIVLILVYGNCDLIRGCSKDVDIADCVFNIQCSNAVEEMDLLFNYYTYNGRVRYQNGYKRDDDNYIDCSYNFIHYGGRNILPVKLRYTDKIRDKLTQIPKYVYRGSYGIDSSIFYSLVTHLDLSRNAYDETPYLHQMERLVFLNLSRNSLTTADLYNHEQLTSLNEIDLSYNTINKIEVVKDEAHINLKVLNLSHNYLVEIPDAIFDPFDKLETLDLSYNFIDTLTISTFEGSKKLEYLFLSHNRLLDINNSFFRFTDLRILNLSYNRIEKIKLTDFEKLVNLEILNLSGNNILEIEKFVLNNAKFLTSINLHSNKLQSIDTNIFLHTNNLEKVDLSNNNFTFIPTGLLKGKNVSMFAVEGNNIEGPLVSGLFEGLGKVKKLDLSGQQWTTVQDYAFNGVQNLSTLLLNKNKLQSLSRNSFKSLNNLILLDLSENNITDFNIDTSDLTSLNVLSLRNNFLTQIKQEPFQSLNSLIFLNLASNKITNIQANSFKYLFDIINFELSNNPLSVVLEEDTFKGLQSLPYLILSETKLVTFKNKSFSGMKSLKELNVSHNKLNDLEYNCFMDTGELESIDLSYNQLRTFEINVTELSNLNSLFLNNNLIKTITGNTFMGLWRLVTIQLSYNNIKTINNMTFHDQKDLEYLDLSFNLDLKLDVSFMSESKKLKHLLLSGIRTDISFKTVKDNQVTNLIISYSGLINATALYLKPLNRLENVVLNNNNISKLELGAFTNLNNLKNLDLSFNKITFIQPGVFKDNVQLTNLNISHNSLVNIGYGIFRGLNHLKVLDMSYNNINNLESERFYEVRSLSVLLVDNNNIDYFNVDEFAGTELQALSIGKNPIPCELLVNLKKSSVYFNITAIKLDESNEENIDGVTCNSNGYKFKPKHNTSNVNKDEKILFDIREILNKIASKEIVDVPNVDKNDYSEAISNLRNEMVKIENIYDAKLTSLVNSSLVAIKVGDDTNNLLQKILKTLNREDFQTTRKPLIKENVTEVHELIQYVNKLKEELEKKLTDERNNILDEVDRRLSVTVSEAPPSRTPAKEKLTANKETREGKSLFTETCVALILLILVCFVMYKFYKSRMFVRNRRSYSTRELPDAMESQDL